MDKTPAQILAYITSDKDRIIGGDPLTLYVTDEDEKKSCVLDISRALRADIVQLKNGDYMIISDITR